MSGSGSMRRVWMGVTLAIAAISAWPAWANHISWWMPGTAFALFLVLALEPWFLTWQLRRRGEELQITDEGVLRKLARGVKLDDGFKTAPAEIKSLKPTDKNGWYEVTLFEGHNQQIRKMFDSIGHSVVKLKRIAIGTVTDSGLPVGKNRKLTDAELKALGYKRS